VARAVPLTADRGEPPIELATAIGPRLNRYSPDAVVLRDPAVGELKVTGRFKLDRTAEALAMISALLEIDAARTGDHVYLTPRRPPRGARRVGRID
jgi:ferric-dicitrate binding protein FerR (iron transport regulator)